MHIPRSRNASARNFSTNFELSTRALTESVGFKAERLEILSIDPSSKWFIVWFAVSCYFPVVTACLGPLSNMISVACAVDHWRIDPHTGHQVSDPPGIRVLNIISLVSGVIANFVLLLNFTGKLAYVKAQIICISGWIIAQLTLTIALLISTLIYFEDGYQRSIGYWYAVITACLYLLCLILQSIHVSGYYKKKYPATFNLLDNERLLMKFTFVFAIWFLWGAAMFSQLLGQTYGASLYFCVVSVLTIGLGDIFPDNTASEVMILIYSLVGLIVLGLIVVMISGTMKSSSGPIFFFYSVEIQREKVYQKYLANPALEFTDHDAYETIQSIRKRSKMLQRRNSIILTITLFALFLMLGALVLYFSESWTYFEAFYFCLLSVLTIGYGVPSPVSGCGRAFYVIWCLGAVPLMTVLISTVGDWIYEISKSIDNNILEYFHLGNLYRMAKYCVGKVREQFVVKTSSMATVDQTAESETLPDEQEFENYEQRVISDNICSLSSSKLRRRGSKTLLLKCKSLPSLVTSVRKETRFSKIAEIKELLDDLEDIDQLSHQDQAYEFTYTEWVQYLRLESKPSQPNQHLFWISEDSPLRYPLRQPLYLSYKIIEMINATLDSLLAEIEIDELMNTPEVE
ncbi:Tok1p [Kluyveromyces lactis]|uniref:KLLA0F14212p n=1 Tax=Kluyveromyces lactis (strain ATCC 8585 / CBS 2359 / DSM 70799 / NBRC 1267 / NRRL Y-1140 / WM37) TaxID=284590 RepID=Q6CK21_KLULA|nr:uncharacterized protein KLLA0_F14212g [Kluyveromyces lactis]CAG98426.1 KLLA0F14212p [Kluyveromyces lactis]|eukprot:XP_455718.1 uncharacterized protein KLLA0_F14212g [Kluyveromyces lactis]